MKKAGLAVLVLIVVIALVTVFSGLYTIEMHEQVIITRFQKPVGGAVIEPGLHWKVPYVDKANFFEKRYLEWDGDPKEIPTLDKKYIWIDTYARWKIAEPLLFFQRVRNEEGAQNRLDDILNGNTRIKVANYNLIEIVRSSNREFKVPEELKGMEDLVKVDPVLHGRDKIMHEILDISKDDAAQFGIELVDIRIKRINYIPSVRQKVYERMISERKRIAEKYRSEGKGESEKILGDMDKDLRRIRSEGFRKAQEIIGEADAKAAKIYADSYNQAPDFYKFWKSMDTLKLTMDENSTLVLTTDGDLYKYLKGPE
jgi:modulator of FtsH protease HflC